MKALVIDEPWIGLILRGEKTWEMRKTACHQRGLIGLIKKGSRQVVGVATIAGSLPPIADPDSYRAAEPKHRIPLDRQGQAFSDGWRTPWVIENARPLTRPVNYHHPFGAVIWVNLDPDVAETVAEQLGSTSASGSVPTADLRVTSTERPRRMMHPTSNPRKPSSPAAAVRDVIVTGGNLRNNHIYLPLEFFPADAIGGSNKRKAAPRTITVTFRPGATVETDIDRTKRILRARTQVGDFLFRNRVREGDAIRITRTSPYS